MRYLSFFLSLAICLTFACGGINKIGGSGVKGSGTLKSETRNLSGFKKIKAAGAISLNVTVQKDFAVAVETDDNLMQHITTEVSGETLSISPKDSINPSSMIKVTVSMPALTDMDISGASTAAVTDMKGGDLDLNASGASKITVGGEVGTLDADASGASSINAENLKAENAKANSSGASTVTVNAASEADLQASGASTVIYLGEPKKLTQNSSGASSIKKK